MPLKGTGLDPECLGNLRIGATGPSGGHGGGSEEVCADGWAASFVCGCMSLRLGFLDLLIENRERDSYCVLVLRRRGQWR